MNLADVRRLGEELSNWGRWGADDERGTLNHITPERVVAATGLVADGTAVRCGLNFDDTGPWGSGPVDQVNRYNPRHTMTMTGNEHEGVGGFRFADDLLDMPLQGSTQWDALAHVHYDGLMYNGRPASSITMDAGAASNSIDRVADGVIGRGVLLDVARLHGVDRLPIDHSVDADELDACAAAQEDTEVRPGDVLLVRTGDIGHQRRHGWEPTLFDGSPGLSVHCARWLHEHEISAVAGDCVAVECHPTRDVDDCVLPLHQVCIRDMGMMFGEFFDLEDLAAACQSRRRWAFLFVGVAMPVTGAVGCPVNPIAVL